MEHRGITYRIVQSIDPERRWKWEIDMPATGRMPKSGQSKNRQQAIRDAESAISRALAPVKLKLKKDV